MSDARTAKGKPALRLLLPSDGDLHQPTLDFLRGCGLPVRRPNARRYTATVPAIPGVDVLFQRTADITAKVEEGSAELGITGLDRLLEYREDESAGRPSWSKASALAAAIWCWPCPIRGLT